MAKAVAKPAAKAEEAPIVSEGKRRYEVAEGVEWVNGQKLKGRKTVDLTDAEAAYDLVHGFIALKSDG